MSQSFYPLPYKYKPLSAYNSKLIVQAAIAHPMPGK